MKSFRIAAFFLLLAVAGSMLLAACSKPADDAVMTAEDAIKAAVAAGAEDSSPKLLEKAQNLLQEAKMLNEQGQHPEARKKAEYAVMRAHEAEKNATRMSEVAKKKAEDGTAQEPTEAGEGK